MSEGKNNGNSIISKGLVEIIVLLVITIGTALYFGYSILKGQSNNDSSSANFSSSNENNESPRSTPTSFPFQEITIPYLRQKEFKSTLENLEKVSENGQFTSFTTSYYSDGYRVYGLLTVPKGDTPEGGWPAVIFVHGYIPPQNYKTLQNYNSFIDPIARNGFVVFKIDLRGHDRSEGIAHGAYYSEVYIVDALNAYSALQKAEFVNPEKIGLWGHSMAGNVVFRSMVAKKDIPAVAIWAGAVYTYEDFQSFRISDASYQPPPQESERRKRREELFKTYGEFNPESEFWRQIVPTNYLDGVTGAILVNHAMDDNVVDIGYSRNLMKILDVTNIDHDLKEYPFGGHNLTGSTFTQAIGNTVNFFKTNLKTP